MYIEKAYEHYGDRFNADVHTNFTCHDVNKIKSTYLWGQFELLWYELLSRYRLAWNSAKQCSVCMHVFIWACRRAGWSTDASGYSNLIVLPAGNAAVQCWHDSSNVIVVLSGICWCEHLDRVWTNEPWRIYSRHNSRLTVNALIVR